MSYTSIEVVNVLYLIIMHSSLYSNSRKPDGELSKYERPLNSIREDGVINSLGLDRDDVQEGVLNFNLYVPNLAFPDNPSDKSQPYTKRILELSKLTNEALGNGDDVWDPEGKWCFNLQQDNVFQDENNQHYINFRVEFYLNN